MPSKRKSKDVEEKQSISSKKAKLSTTVNDKKLNSGTKSLVKPRAKTPTKPQTVEKLKSKTPVKPRAKTPVKPRAKTSKTPVKPSAKPSGNSNTKTRVTNKGSVVDVSSRVRPREWEENAAQVLREHLKQMEATGNWKQGSTKTKTKDLTDTDSTSSCDDSNYNGYLQAYWNLPSLKHRDELPPCFFRACIFDGYRDHWTWHEATVSLFSMHNETMCIWSHLLPLMCAVVAAVWLGLQMQADGSTFVEQLMMGIYIATACTCLLLSSLYHWYGCMSAGHYLCLLSFDLGGIACLIAGSFFPGVYYGFYCTPVLQKVYIGVTCLIFLIGMIVSIFGATESPNAAVIRQGGFGSLTVFGFVPLCHWLLIAPNEYKDEMTIGALGMFFFYGLGFSFLLTSFPESVWTNNYYTTYVFPSHALWHLGVAAAIFTWLFALLGQQQLLRDMGCQPFDDYIDEFGMRSFAF